MVTVTGSIEDVVFYNPENGWSVLALNCQDDLFTVVGTFPELAVGEEVEVTGEFTYHPRFGQQLKVASFRRILPVDVVGIERYLASGLIKGIGSHFAAQIVRKFGAQTLEIIDKQPERLLEVAGIGGQKIQQIVVSWREQKNVYEVMTFLQSIDVTTNLAVKICKEYGVNAVQVVRQDPYRLAQDIRGIGFVTADRIAASQGLPKDHPSRILAGLVFALRDMIADGHVYVPRGLLEQKAVQLLGLEIGKVSAALDGCAASAQEAASPAAVVREVDSEGADERVYLLPYLVSENGLADRLAYLVETGERRSRVAGSTLLLPSLVAGDDITAEQRRAVENALRHPVSVMTGGPGTGKSYTVATLIAALESISKKYALAAPTGRAAKRLAESTGRKASTIHRLLSFVPDEEQEDLLVYDEPEELDLDLVVVDEASMLDLPLAYRLLKAIPGGCHLLLVGDVDQLPSVGAGNFLRDVIDSGVAPVTRLTEIFRQAASSLIVANAHRINQGILPALDNDPRGDFFFFNIESGGAAAAEQVESLVTERIPTKFGLKAEDIQVLSPMYRGEAGVKSLNQRLQDALNPPGRKKKERSLAGTRFREGDRVMQIRNEYDKEVFNGDIGRLVKIEEEEGTLLVEMDGRGILYEFNEADQLVLAYASTIHKSQGSEYPCVVMVMLSEHQVMLARNLLYTGITRAQKLCILISNRRAVSAAVNNNRVTRRFSALSERLRERIG
jgi:exodeoxyribonuclease V alpha subunit